MLILGVIDSRPSTVALLADGRIISAVSEERLCRMKLANGFPRQALALTLETAGLAPEDIDVVAIGAKTNAFELDPSPWPGWFDDGKTPKKRLFNGLSSALAPLAGSIPAARRAHHVLKRTLHRDRPRRIRELLQSEFEIRAPVYYYDHHLCHAASAYYTSAYDPALVVTLDGGGDGRSGSLSVGEKGQLRWLASIDSFHSLGNFYSYITALCGFRAAKDEGKITGLAALGEPEYVDILRGFVKYQHPGTVRYSIPMYRQSALRAIRNALPDNFDRAALASSAQLVLEEVGAELVRYWVRHTGIRNVVAAGGVFANVKFNQRIHELEEVDSLFIHPAMDDGGTALGAAFVALGEHLGSGNEPLPHHLKDAYLGPGFTDDEIQKALGGCDYPFRREEDIHTIIAQLLAKGHVVARFNGRMEYGPRALGNRSILYGTTDPGVNDWLNVKLRRTEFMPFAPATLTDFASRCYEGLSGAEDAARFMTITFDCSQDMKAMSPGVVHADGTARPQLVDSGSAPDLHAILVRYQQMTGIPSLVNTSFNMHGEPIVCTPEDALRSFQAGDLDYLALGPWLVTNPSVDRQAEGRLMDAASA